MSFVFPCNALECSAIHLAASCWVMKPLITSIQNEMRNDLDDYLFDVMRDGKGHPLTPDLMDEIIDRILSIARARMPD